MFDYYKLRCVPLLIFSSKINREQAKYGRDASRLIIIEHILYTHRVPASDHYAIEHPAGPALHIDSLERVFRKPECKHSAGDPACNHYVRHTQHTTHAYAWNTEHTHRLLTQTPKIQWIWIEGGANSQHEYSRTLDNKMRHI